MLSHPSGYRAYVFFFGFRIAPNTVVNYLVEGLFNRIGYRKVHIRHPEWLYILRASTAEGKVHL